MKSKEPLHQKEALRLLRDGKPHTIRVWKLSSGEILEYKDCVCISNRSRLGTHRIKLQASQEVRDFRDITLHYIDGHSIYL